MSSLNKTAVSLVVLMGLPASGKTTLCDEISQQFSEKGEITIIKVAYDNFVPIEKQSQYAQGAQNQAAKILRSNFVQCIQFIAQKLTSHAEQNDSLELLLSAETDDFVSRNTFIDKVKTLLEVTEHKNNRDVIILVDDNNYYHSMRNEFYQVSRRVQIGFCILYCKSSLTTCRSRNSNRPQNVQVPEDVIFNMNSKLEEPNPLDNPCDVYCFQIPEEIPSGLDSVIRRPFQDTIATTITILEISLRNPLFYEIPVDRTEEIEKERKICSENAVHQADLLLRKWIHTEITLSSLCTKNRKDIKNLSDELNRKKNIIISGLKSGELRLQYDHIQDVEFRSEVIALVRNVKL